MDSPYSEISADRYPFSNRELSNRLLRGYFDDCFDGVFEVSGAYPAWACMACAARQRPTVSFDPKSKSRCPNCDSDQVFEIATFQSRSARMGQMFEAAVRCLFLRKFGLELRPTP